MRCPKCFAAGEQHDVLTDPELLTVEMKQNGRRHQYEDVEDEVRFKFLINDEIWAEGENLKAASGSESASSPVFIGW